MENEQKWSDFKHTKRSKHHCEGMDAGLGDPDDLLIMPVFGETFIPVLSGRAFMCRYCPLCGEKLG